MISNLSVTILAVSILLVAVDATNLQHVYAQIDPGNFVLWKKTTHEYEKDLINAVIDPNSNPQPRELLVGYVGDMNRIFIGDPNIDRMLKSYQEDVSTIFDQQPPDPDKQIKDFRGLTHEFKKAVIDAFTGPE